MYRMGFDTTGHLLHMNNATTAGIHAVFKPMPAERAVVNTGAIINATTTGLMPLKMAERVGLFVISSGVRNIAMSRIMRKLGMMVPSDDMMLPLSPRSLSPTTTDMFTAKIPGIDWATARRSRNSSRSSQWYLSTISRSMIEIIAQPPPKVKAPILANVQNSFPNI